MNIKRHLLVRLGFLLYSLVSTEPICPQQCVCKPLENRRGATAVNCEGANLNKVPKELEDFVILKDVNLSQNIFTEITLGLHSSITKLDMRHNKIHSLKGEAFNSFYNIEEIYLDHNHLTSLENTDFTNAETKDQTMPYLGKLGLSHNRIKSYGEAPFRSVPSLKALTLSHNEMVDLRSELFKGATMLELIDLSHNLITSVEKGTFKNMLGLKYVYLSWNQIAHYPEELPMMDWLDLSHNSIKYIEEDQKEDIYPVEMLNLAHNPLICDCKTRWLKELYDRREYVLKYINIPTWEFVPTCVAPPSLAGEGWDVLGDDVFICETGDDVQSTEFIDDLGTLLHHEHIVNVMTSVVNVVHNSAIIKWALDDPDGKCKKLYVQYYELSSKDSTMLIAPVSIQLTSYMISNLQPEVQYKACVLPATSKSEVPSSIISPLQCVQFFTGAVEKDPKQNLQEESRTKWSVPDSEEITAYSKLIGLCFMVSVLITGACLFIYEIVLYCYLMFFRGKSTTDDQILSNKTHTD